MAERDTTARAQATAEARAMLETEVPGSTGEAVTVAEVLWAHTYFSAEAATGNAELAMGLAESLLDEAMLTETLYYVFAGISPVLLHRHKAAPEVVPNWMISVRLNEHLSEDVKGWWEQSDGEPTAIVVVPLLNGILAAYAAWKRPLTFTGNIWPSFEVWHLSHDSKTITAYRFSVDPSNGNASVRTETARPIITTEEWMSFQQRDLAESADVTAGPKAGRALVRKARARRDGKANVKR